MTLRSIFMGCAAVVLLTLSGCEVLTPEETDGMTGSRLDVYCDATSGRTRNGAAGLKIVGTIQDVIDEYEEFSDPNYSNTREATRTDLTVTLDLTFQDDAGHLTGTAKVTWERHDQHDYRQDPGVCADGLKIDSNVREWTVNITGQLFCDSDGRLGIMGSGSPDGSDVPLSLHYYDFNCKPQCPPCYDKTETPKHFVTWGSFMETGFEHDKLVTQINYPVVAPQNGLSYHSVNLTITSFTEP